MPKSLKGLRVATRDPCFLEPVCVSGSFSQSERSQWSWQSKHTKWCQQGSYSSAPWQQQPLWKTHLLIQLPCPLQSIPFDPLWIQSGLKAMVNKIDKGIPGQSLHTNQLSPQKRNCFGIGDTDALVAIGLLEMLDLQCLLRFPLGSAVCWQCCVWTTTTWPALSWSQPERLLPSPL